jgi:hypothetical protein
MPGYARFVTTRTFRREYEGLSPDKKQAAIRVFREFKKDPFAANLGTHKIARLSALYKEPVWSVPVMGDLRVLFVVRGETIVSISIGKHAIYG